MPTALVTGASRGVGRGIAIALAGQGFTVYGTGRSIAQADLPDDIRRIPCDHLDDEQTAAVFRRIEAEQPALDLLVNCAWGGYESMVVDGRFVWNDPFWERPELRWHTMIRAGVRPAYLCAAHAARGMAARTSGLIVNISYWAAQTYLGNVAYGIAKAATDKMSSDMAEELRSYGVAVLSLYPGLVRTEAVLSAAKAGWLDLTNSESPEFCGLVIAALFRDPHLLDRSGNVAVAAQLALEYGLKDTDGRQPVPLTLDEIKVYGRKSK